MNPQRLCPASARLLRGARTLWPFCQLTAGHGGEHAAQATDGSGTWTWADGESWVPVSHDEVSR